MKKSIISVLCAIFIILSALPIAFASQVTSEPVIVSTVYPTEDTVIADIIATEAPYYADNTGEKDATAAIQKAIDDCYNNGGGTVFLPDGKYRLTGSLYIRRFVTLRGDWSDPDLNKGYGTLIIADVESSDSMNPALIKIGASAGAVGLTVWYPHQDIDNVLPYPYTFYFEGNGDYMLASLINCTLINSYRGIGASSECENGIYECHEMFTVENVKGTCLYEGLNSHNSADVDTYKTLYFLNAYWAEAGEEFNAPDIEKLNNYTRTHGYGLVIGDLEWPQFSDIKISQYLYGIDFREGIRYCFSGEFTDLYITDCTYGITIPEDIMHSRGYSWGLSVTSGVIEGSSYAIYSPGSNNIILTDVETDGFTYGGRLRKYYTELSDFAPTYNKTYIKPSDVLYVADADKSGKTDASADVQAVLDKAAATGGIVYLPAGLYRFEGPVSVPDGVEFRGSSSVATRCQRDDSRGTLIYSVYGYNEGDKPLVTLGRGSGAYGLRFDYPENAPKDTSGAYKKTSPVIYAGKDNAYVVNCSITLASTGICLEGSDNVFIKKVIGCCFENMFKLTECENVFIEGCLQNANTLPRNGYTQFDIPEFEGRLPESELFNFVFIPITRIHTNYIALDSCKDITVFSSFIYGGKSFISSVDSEVHIYNSGHDGSSKTEPAFIFDAGKATLINTMRSTSDGKLGQNFYSIENDTAFMSFGSQAVDMLYREHPVIINVERNALPGNGLLYLILQPLYRIITFFGNLYMNMKQG